MGHGCRVCAVLLIVAGMFGTAHAISGSLSYDGGGITGTYGNFWLASGTALDWSVNANGNGTYTYTYELQVPDDSKEISHLIIEVSPTFTSDNLLEVLKGTVEEGQPDSYPKGGADPGMPSSLWGIKFEDGYGETDYDWIVSFISDRAPVWGDFYAVDGKRPGAITAIWNEGFGNPDFDGPTDHIMVPDSTSYVPAPGAILLAGVGMALVRHIRARRWV